MQAVAFSTRRCRSRHQLSRNNRVSTVLVKIDGSERRTGTSGGVAFRPPLGGPQVAAYKSNTNSQLYRMTGIFEKYVPYTAFCPPVKTA